MEKHKKLNDEQLNEVNGGGGIYNTGNISNPDKIFGGGAIHNTATGDGIINSMFDGNHEFNYGMEDNDD